MRRKPKYLDRERREKQRAGDWHLMFFYGKDGRLKPLSEIATANRPPNENS